MADSNRQDLQLGTGGVWEPYEVFTAEDDAVVGVEEALEAKGWESFLDLGSSERFGIEVNLYQRRIGTGHPEYLLAVWGEQLGAPFLKVDSLPAAMQLLSQWAPAVQAASISRVLSDLAEGAIEHTGLVETIAARAAWGVQERLPKLKEYRDQEDRDAAARRRTARAAQTT